MIILHGYWRSGASYRLRIALNIKRIVYEQHTYDLRLGEQRSEHYMSLNPQHLVPTLETDGKQLIQSSAIAEWLEECHPNPPLLPQSNTDRAIVRAMVGIIGCDVHPLNNLRILQSLRQDFSADERQVRQWIARWIGDGFSALEKMIAIHGGAYAFGDTITLADCWLVPQLYSADRFGVDLTPYPHLVAAGQAARSLAEFVTAHPDQQSDADAISSS